MSNILKGKCSHCGKPMKEESNNNWSVYCMDSECADAFLTRIMAEKCNK